jgi:Tol biopolymer transport system component
MPTFSPWSAPVNLGTVINSPGVDAGAAISKDGLSLYFNSDRRGGFGDQDIWVSQRARLDATWGIPLNLGPTINTDALDSVPSFSRDEHWMFFNSNRPGGFGLGDVWASYRTNIHDNFAWTAPINLGSAVNSAFIDAGAFLSENDETGSPLLFFVSTRPGGFGNFDIYVSPLMTDGSFGPPSLVRELSSPANDRRPSVRFDGLEVFLDSDRPGSTGADLWTSIRDTASQPWSTPINLGPAVNSAVDDIQPYIAADRQTLVFASNRPGGSGGFDLYVTTRAKVTGR